MSFDTLAPIYRPMEAILAGRVLQLARTCFLDAATPCRKALLLGEGAGRFLLELLQAHPRIEVTCVEQSHGMIRQTRALLERHGIPATRIHFEPVDALQWRPPHGNFDLVASHFFLDCFQPDEIHRLATLVARCTTADARWLLADFRVPDAGWRRLRARAIHRLMYAFFRTVTDLSAARLTPPDRYLSEAGFRLEARRLYSLGLLHSDCWRKGHLPG